MTYRISSCILAIRIGTPQISTSWLQIILLSWNSEFFTSIYGTGQSTTTSLITDSARRQAIIDFHDDEAQRYDIPNVSLIQPEVLVIDTGN